MCPATEIKKDPVTAEATELSLTRWEELGHAQLGHRESRNSTWGERPARASGLAASVILTA